MKPTCNGLRHKKRMRKVLRIIVLIMTIILAVPGIVFMIILTVLYGCVMQERQNDMKTENPKRRDTESRL